MATAIEWLFRLFIPLAMLALAFGTGARIAVRHFLRDVRARRIGEMVWVELVYEGSAQNGRGRERFDQDEFSGVYAFTEQLRVSRWPYSDRGVASFIWHKGSDGLIRLYAGMTSSSADGQSQFRSLADSLKCRFNRLDGPPPIPLDNLMIAQRSRAIAASVKDQVDRPGTVAAALSSTMDSLPRGESAAFIVTMDMMRNSESQRLEANIAEESILRAGRAAMMQSLAPQARLMANRATRVTFGATNSSGGEGFSREVLMNGINAITTLGWTVNVMSPRKLVSRNATLVAVVAAVVNVLLTLVGVVPLIVGIVLALPALVVAYLSLTKQEALCDRWFRDRLAKGEIVVPSFVYWNLRWFVLGNFRGNRDIGNDDGNQLGSNVAPPSCKQVLSLHAAAAYELVSFPDRMAVDVSRDTVQSRGLPSNMVDVDWPVYFGRSGTGQFVAMDLSDLHYGLYTAGIPGSGKTNFLQVIFAGAVKASIEHHGGLQITPVWSETKGEGAYDAWRIARHHPQAMFIDAHNPRSSYRLALEGRRLVDGASVDEVNASCSTFVNALQFAYGDGIRAASREILDGSLRVSLLLSSEEIRHLELDTLVDPVRPNVMDLAFYIMGGDSRVDPGPKLLAMQSDLASGAPDERQEALLQAIGTLSRFLGKNRKGMEQQISSPLNKLSDLRNARHMFTPDSSRADAYVNDLPTRFAPIVINMGPYYVGDGVYDNSINTAISRRLLLALNYLMWDRIKSTCSGWQKQGKRIPMFFDEVADVAVESDSEDVANVIAEGLKEGRSRGASWYLGCQFPSQMPYQARHNVLSSRSKFWFQLQNSEDLKLAMDDLSSGDSSTAVFDQASVRGIPDGTCVGIMKRLNTVTPPFTLRVPLATKWAEFLLQPNVSVEDAVAQYSEWDDRQREMLMLSPEEPVRAAV